MNYENPIEMLECVKDSIEYRRKHTSKTREIIMRLAGDDYRADWMNTPEVLSNFHYWIYSNMRPALVYSNPMVTTSDLMGMRDDPQILALHYGMRAWVQMKNIANPLGQIADDMIVGFGVGVCGVQKAPGQSGPSLPGQPPKMIPVFKRLSPMLYFQDYVPENPLEPMFAGNTWIRSKARMLEETGPDGVTPKYDRAAVQQLVEGQGLSDLRRDMLHDRSALSKEEDLVIGYDVFCPETGLIYTLGEPGVWLREPRPSMCSARGPYTLYGAYWLPGCIYPLAPCAVSAGMAREINAHQQQAKGDAGSAKSMAVARSAKLADTIAAGKNGSVQVIPDFTKDQIEQIDIGGLNQTNIDWTEIRSRDFEKQSGITPTLQGTLTGVTKGEIEQAQSAVDSRLRFVQQRFRDRVVESLKTVAWIMAESELVQFDAPVAEAGEITRFRGGTHLGMEPLNFDRVKIEIEPFSMEDTGDLGQQRQIDNAIGSLGAILEMGERWPFLHTKAMVDDKFEAMNMPHRAEKYVDWELYGLMKAAALMAPAPEEGGDEPKKPSGGGREVKRGKAPAGKPAPAMA